MPGASDAIVVNTGPLPSALVVDIRDRLVILAGCG